MFKDNTYPFGTDQSALWAITYIWCNVAWYRNMPSLLRSSLSPTYVLHDCTCSLDDMVYTKLWIQSLFILIISPHLFFYNHVHYRCRQCKLHSHLRDVSPSSHTCCCIAVAAHCKTLKQAAAPEHFSMKKKYLLDIFVGYLVRPYLILVKYSAYTHILCDYENSMLRFDFDNKSCIKMCYCC